MIIPDSVILVLGWMAEQAQAGTLYQSLFILGLFVFIGIPVIICVVGPISKKVKQQVNQLHQAQQQVYQQAPPKKQKFTEFRKPKTPKPKAVEDYDLGPLLYCPNVACRSEHLQTKANGQKYCTKCGWNK
tara:strand:+ start:182 stop:571 length:390 start_codon:yes stop_codon:yes gene_type:complete